MITDKAFTIPHLEPLAFLTSSAKVVNFGDDIIDLSERPEDITFVRFRRVLDGSSLDKRVIHTHPLSFHFCLRLPQYLYDVDTKIVTPSGPTIDVPTPTAPGAVAQYLASVFEAAVGTPTAPTLPTTSSPFSSPAMKLFLKSLSKGGKIKKEYYGDLTFLDSQA